MWIKLCSLDLYVIVVLLPDFLLYGDFRIVARAHFSSSGPLCHWRSKSQRWQPPRNWVQRPVKAQEVWFRKHWTIQCRWKGTWANPCKSSFRVACQPRNCCMCLQNFAFSCFVDSNVHPIKHTVFLQVLTRSSTCSTFFNGFVTILSTSFAVYFLKDSPTFKIQAWDWVRGG